MPVLLLAAFALTACDGDTKASRPRAAATESPLLVEFQRQGRVSATFDKLRLRTDGSGEIDRRYGGAGRRITKVTVEPRVLREIRAAVRDAPSDPKPSGTPAADGSGFHYIVRWDGGQATAETGAVPRALRPLVRRLDGVIDGEGR